MFKYFKWSLEKEYQDLELLKNSKKKIIIDTIIKAISLFLILFFWYLIIVTLIVDDNIFPREVVIVSETWLQWIALPLLFWGLFLSVFWLLVTLIFKSTKEIDKEIEELNSKIEQKKIENKNYKDVIRPIEKLTSDLKYKINLLNVQQNSFNISLEKIINIINDDIISQINYEMTTPDEKIGSIIKTIFNSRQNWNNNRTIIQELKDKDSIFLLLFYITLSLRKLNEIWLWDDSSIEENEQILLEIKKLLEWRIIILNKLEKEEIKNQETRKKEVSELLTSDENF